MIYIVTESLMNGTVAMSINTFGISADNFVEAKTKLITTLNIKLLGMWKELVSWDIDKIFRYSVDGSVIGSMENKSLEIYE